MARSDSVTLKFVPETTYGVTPTNSALWRYLRITGEDFKGEAITEESEELSGDELGVMEIVVAGQNVSGGINFELSYATFDWALEAVLAGTWTSNNLQNGTVKRSFSFEKHIPDIGRYYLYRGCVVNGVDFKIEKNKRITGSIKFTCSQVVNSATSSVGSGTVAAINENKIFRAGSTITNIEINDLTTESQLIRISSLNINISANSEPEQTIDKDFATGVNILSIKPELDFSIYYDNDNFYNKFLLGEKFKFEITLNDGAGNSYKFTMPACQFTSGAPDGASKGKAIMGSFKAVATVDSGLGYYMNIFRD
jgi:Phage tail tube protein